MDALRSVNLSGEPTLSLEAPCGGKGKCGRCVVKAWGEISPPSPEELQRLSAAELQEGWRLACQARLEGRVWVQRPKNLEASIIAEGPRIERRLDPPVRRLSFDPAPPRLEDQGSDEDRILDAVRLRLAAENIELGRLDLPYALLPCIAGSARGGAVEAVVEVAAPARVLAVRPWRGEVRPSYGLAVDIGTTTVVAYLLDLETGEIRDLESGLNEQRSFGADVISRIAATMDAPGGLAELKRRIAGQISSMASSLLGRAGAGREDLLCATIAGNTTMLHLLAGVQPEAMAASPFSPVFTSLVRVEAQALGLEMGPPGSDSRSAAYPLVYLLPGVSAYVGADIVAGIAALGMAEREEFSLLLDIGTNGELAAGNSKGIICCATAAGPAFEGGGISMGSGGVEGAVDSVWIDEGRLAYTTIGGKPARGLCGSGVIDALAAFLDLGLVDATGRILDADELSCLDPAFAWAAGLLGSDSDGLLLRVDECLWLSQRDIRNLQLAIAAIAAGVAILLAEAEKTAAEVDRVYLAGGFGSRLRMESATRVGLIPKELEEKVVVAGNSSGSGAIGACLSREGLTACLEAKKRCTYLELSSRPDFNDAYIEHMLFPEKA
jgi:uncharacterized 2Fe-2S/4Fe-4S cluster protein (DUF4445 family)